MSTIKVQVRIRPPGANPAMEYNKDQKKLYSIDYNDDVLSLIAPDRLQTESDPAPQKFKFDRVYDESATQEDVFDGFCKPLLPEYFAGYNCCVMCYGQTGSGKSYTQTGGTQSYKQRGLMPRALEYIYTKINEDKTHEYEVYISYIQILNEGGFDLLTPPQDRLTINRQQLDNLNKVTLQETSENCIKVKGLAAFRADNLEAALNILWTGDLNRVVTATSQNQASSRSHCIFTILLVQRPSGSDTVRRSKFHFVDLAGSERVSRTGADGVVLQQARYINVSLFHLETVIQALHRSMTQPNTHVPYRNSMMTLYLKDSLGGNCKTALLATVAVEQQNMSESVATCQFAMQVGCIKNKAMVNEEMDLNLLVKRLKTENMLLKEELKLLKEGEGASAQKNLSAEDIEDIRKKVREYLADQSIVYLQVGNYWRMQAGIQYMRELYLERPLANTTAVQNVPESEKQIARLKELLQQRDAEIEILTQMAGGKAPPGAAAGPMYDYAEVNGEDDEGSDGKSIQFEAERGTSSRRSESIQDTNRNISRERSVIESQVNQSQNEQQSIQQNQSSSNNQIDANSKQPKQNADNTVDRMRLLSCAANLCQVNLDNLSLEELRSGDGKVYQLFQRGYYKTERLNEDRKQLNYLYSEARRTANRVVSLKKQTEGLKKELLDLIQQVGAETPESDVMKESLQRSAQAYKEAVAELKGLRGRVEALEADLASGKEQMRRDFVRWYQYALKYVMDGAHGRPAAAFPRHPSDDDLQREIDLFYAARRGAGV